jgi:hypothetical protein
MLYIIKANVDVYEDDYSYGEADYVNSWSESHEVVADSEIEAISKSMEKMCYSLDTKYLDNDDGIYRYSVIVDDDNCEASLVEIEAWKLGDKKLYSANINFAVYKMISSQ